ncbi:PPM-type phosphatase domain-containing protein [Mycena indigotica]|uniref:PPM-type phosphatase domain-containing protein n=1 Tax=Mycena indigotica TaxID=2126181 RepID=A0A8H6W794_9AGAR|nr:PPM-type phosphatase domain-containing protein [Mycena indigotica]KAF7301884.1 PPM-type phosphatase domain-containing protein [Mycena indigotica]
MFRRAWKPAAVVVPAALGYWYYNKPRNEYFDFPVRERGPDGKATMSTKTLPLLSTQEVDARLRENAVEHTVTRPGIVWHHSTASVAANDPIEDATANQVIRKDEGDGDLMFFAVMDGHGGGYTSQLLSRVLINAVALELAALKSKTANSWTDTLKNTFWKTPQPTTDIHAAPGEPTRVATAIQRAFLALDAELIAAPVRVLASALDGDKSNLSIPDLSKHPLALPSMLPAMSGSCAILALLDTARRNLYVACTGDSRAVAGIWEPQADGKGHWRVEVLSEDQTGRNPAEAARMRREHPSDEAADVIRNGRVLGGLEPTRAFGDARYKWSRGLQETLAQAFLSGSDRKIRPPPPTLKTPPYVTSRPIVQHRVLELPDQPASGQERALRFIVLATDGLWDELSSEDVVRLVGGHLNGLKGTVPKPELATLVPTLTGAAAVEGKTARRQRDSEGWAFVDSNPSAHLIRNAFGGADTNALRRLLSIPAPHARRHRDDVSVTVVWWEAGNEQASPEIASVSLPREQVKAKL